MRFSISNCRLPICWLTFAWIDLRMRIRTEQACKKSEIDNGHSAMFLAVAEGFEPSIAGLTIRCLTNLATPQEMNLAAVTRLELAHPRLQDERSVIKLSYAAIWWTGGIQTLTRSFQDFYAIRYMLLYGEGAVCEE